MFNKRITIEREPDNNMNKYEPIIIELKPEEIMTVDQIRFRLKDELAITDTMACLVDGEQVPGNTVLEDSMQLYFKEGMGDKGSEGNSEESLKHLVGKKIVEVGMGDMFPFFKLDDGTICDISSDQEGNEPGYLFGLPRV